MQIYVAFGLFFVALELHIRSYFHDCEVLGGLWNTAGCKQRRPFATTTTLRRASYNENTQGCSLCLQNHGMVRNTGIVSLQCDVKQLSGRGRLSLGDEKYIISQFCSNTLKGEAEMLWQVLWKQLSLFRCSGKLDESRSCHNVTDLPRQKRSPSGLSKKIVMMQLHLISEHEIIKHRDWEVYVTSISFIYIQVMMKSFKNVTSDCECSHTR